MKISFTTTWDYTTLKHVLIRDAENDGFTTTWDYTTLKLLSHMPILL